VERVKDECRVSPPLPHPDFDLREAQPWEPSEEIEATPAFDPLPIESLMDLLASVDIAGPAKYLVQGVIAAADYGMLGAAFKVGKTWFVTDLAVSVASNTKLLGIWPIETPGPVLLFAGEGGRRKIARRFRAVCESRGVDPATLPIRICVRVPHLTSEAAMLLVAEEIDQHRPVLVVIDPLYLAARGARGSDLYEMGANLEGIQVICQRAGSALLIAHHWNKTGEGKGAKRMSGAGPDAWGRFLISVDLVAPSRIDPDTGGSSVVLDIDFQGDEIAETTTRIRRRVWSDDPNDLSSAMHYEVTHLESGAPVTDPGAGDLTPSARRVLAILDGSDQWWTVQSMGDAVAADSTGMGGLKVRTIQAAFSQLVKADRAEAKSILGGSAGQWRSVSAQYPEIEARDAF
jgi:hypothetical protein